VHDHLLSIGIVVQEATNDLTAVKNMLTDMTQTYLSDSSLANQGENLSRALHGLKEMVSETRRRIQALQFGVTGDHCQRGYSVNSVLDNEQLKIELTIRVETSQPHDTALVSLSNVLYVSSYNSLFP